MLGRDVERLEFSYPAGIRSMWDFKCIQIYLEFVYLLLGCTYAVAVETCTLWINTHFKAEIPQEIAEGFC